MFMREPRGSIYFVNQLLEKKALSRNTSNKIGSPRFLWDYLLEKVPSENVHAGTSFLTVISWGFLRINW
jgi:hypothetical protein